MTDPQREDGGEKRAGSWARPSRRPGQQQLARRLELARRSRDRVLAEQLPRQRGESVGVVLDAAGAARSRRRSPRRRGPDPFGSRTPTPASSSSGLGAARRGQPVAFVAEPGVVQDRRLDAVSPAAATSAQWVSPRHSRRQFTACQPDSTGSAGRGIRRCAAKNTRPDASGAASTTGHSAGPSSASGSRIAGAYAAQPFEHGLVAGRPHRSKRGVSRDEVEGEPDAGRADRAERGDHRVGAGRRKRSGAGGDVAERARQPERARSARPRPDPRRSSRSWSAPIGRCDG